MFLMNIVHVEDMFYPTAGYQLNIIPKYMARYGHKVTIITSKMEDIPVHLTTFFGRERVKAEDDEYTKQTGVTVIRLPLKGFIGGRAVFGKELDEQIRAIAPDILYVHGNDSLTGIRYICKSKRLQMPIILDSHMLEMAARNPFSKIFHFFYRYFITPTIIKNKIIILRTADDDYVERCLGIPISQCPLMPFGSDIMLFHPDDNAKNDFRQKHGIEQNDFVVVYTGKLDEAKGGLLLAQAFEHKFATRKKIILLVVGNISSGSYSEKVDELFAGSENRVIRFPTQKYIDLPVFYQASDLSVFPKQCSLSFFDAQACGLPVIFEDNTINQQRSLYGNGYCYKENDISDFRKKVLMCIEAQSDQYQAMKRKAADYVNSNYNYDTISQKYMEILESEYRKAKAKKN
jgi:glycosyltransferase involved in cell wall biosynthesis